jgi:hypothetical protein
MLNRLRPRLTYANALSTIVLFVVLGGGAYATIDRKVGPKDIRKNAIKKKQLAPKAVGRVHLKRGAVGTPAIRNGAVTAEKLAPGVAVSGPRGPQGIQGPSGPKGDPGEKGDRGDQGTPATRLFAHLRGATAPDGPTLIAGSGVIGLARNGVEVGQYMVTFDRDLRDCTALATPLRMSNPETFDTEAIHVGARVSVDDPRVFISVFDEDHQPDDRDVAVAVFC